MQHGYGVRVTESGHKFEGLSVKGEAVKGKMTLPDGTRYDGSLKAGMYHGEGHLTMPDGEQYKGGFLKGQREGKGLTILPNGLQSYEFWEKDEIVSGPRRR